MSVPKANPLLTIIMPTYNAAATLNVALESIINQTFQNIEVLIIDGLSNDATIGIARKYQLEFPEIKIISEADKGIYDAMNKGIGIAKGEWVYFMGSDDSFYETSTVDHFLKFERIKNYDVLYGNVFSTRFNGVYDGEFTYLKLSTKNICHQSIFFRKSVFKRIGNFNLKYKAHADWDHNIRWFFSSKITNRHVNQIIANYADGGFSSINGDDIFKREKDLKLLVRGLTKFRDFQLLNICKNAILQAKHSKQRVLWFSLISIRPILKFAMIFRKYKVKKRKV